MNAQKHEEKLRRSEKITDSEKKVAEGQQKAENGEC